MSEKIIKKVRALPPLDETIVEVQRICSSEDASVAELARVVEKDPMLTANILKATNSPIYGFSREIKNIHQAVSLFGMATIKGFALAAAVKRNMKIDLKPYGLTELLFVNASAKQSALMNNWYKAVDRSKLEVLVPSAFLMEVGKIVIANVIVEEGKSEEFLEKIKACKNEREISQVEKEFTGLTNEEVASKIFEKWNFDRGMIEAIRYSDDYTKADDEFKDYALALQIVKNTVSSNFDLVEENVNYALELVKKHNLKEKAFLEAIERLK